MTAAPILQPAVEHPTPLALTLEVSALLVELAAAASLPGRHIAAAIEALDRAGRDT
jgi:hypothetical protein